MNIVDTLFASLFTIAAIGSFIAITTITVNLPKEQNAQVLFNSMIGSKVIGVFFALMMVPALYFSFKGMMWSAVSTILLATVAAAALQRLSNRAAVILRQRHYI